MESDALRVRVAKLITEKTGALLDEVLADGLFANVGCDSLDLVEVSIAIDDEFDVDFQSRVRGKHLPKNLAEVMKTLEICLAEKAAA